MSKLRDKVVVVTGASHGLGCALAKQAAAAGAIVVGAARHQADLDQLVAEIIAAGGRASACVTDVGSFESMLALREHALREHGRLDAWVNNAGTAGAFGPVAELAPEQFLTVIDTNIRGTYFGSLLAIRHFREHGGGTLINLLGRGDKTPVPMQCAYGSSKSWVRAFTLALAREQNDRPDIAVYALNPGMVATRMLHRVDVIAGHEQGLAVFPTIVGMWGRPPEVPARALVELLERGPAGKRRVEHQLMGMGSAMLRAASYGLRRLLGRVGPATIELRSLPAWTPRPTTPPSDE